MRGRHESHVVATQKKEGGYQQNVRDRHHVTRLTSSASCYPQRASGVSTCVFMRTERKRQIKLNSLRLHHAPLSALFYAAASEGSCVWSLNKSAGISAASKLQMQSNTKGTSKRTSFQRGHAPKSVSLMCPDAATSTLAAFKSRYTYPEQTKRTHTTDMTAEVYMTQHSSTYRQQYHTTATPPPGTIAEYNHNCDRHDTVQWTTTTAVTLPPSPRPLPFVVAVRNCTSATAQRLHRLSACAGTPNPNGYGFWAHVRARRTFRFDYCQYLFEPGFNSPSHEPDFPPAD